MDSSTKKQEPQVALQVAQVKQEIEKAVTDPHEVIRQLKLEIQARDEKIAMLNEEGRKQRETIDSYGSEGSGQAQGIAHGIENAKKSPISILERIELNKRRQQAAATIASENGLSKADVSEIQKLRGSIKKFEEQKELLSIEKDQLEQEIKEKNAEIDSLKQKIKHGNKGGTEVQDQYIHSLRQFKDLTYKINSMSSSLPTSEDLKDWIYKIEELSKENDRVGYL